MKKSVWSKTQLQSFPPLDGNKKCDVLIIGGGLSGILCAYELHKKGVDYLLIEKDKIASGITKNTTGKITSLHGLIYNHIQLTYGKEKAQMYFAANQKALESYKELAKTIDCDFEEKDAYTYSLKSRAIIEREVQCVTALGGKCSFEEETELPFKVKGAIKLEGQAQFNPLKFIKGIIKDLNIYENTLAQKIENGTVVTNNGTIKAEKIIVCTHFPFLNKHGSYFLKLYQHRSYVSAFENVPEISGMYVDEDLKGMSFRSYNNLTLIGGGSHRTGKAGTAWRDINRFAKENYPLARLKYEWATQDCMSLDKIPYIGHYSGKCKDLYVATGFNKWGMTSSQVAANILCDMVLGKDNDYREVFSPQRKIVHPQLLVNAFESTVNLLTPSLRRCPHLGCGLQWNKQEHTWDCPCHGSRFTKEGELIDNPAKRGLK